jgi:hypothetical protein
MFIQPCNEAETEYEADWYIVRRQAKEELHEHIQYREDGFLDLIRVSLSSHCFSFHYPDCPSVQSQSTG